MTATSLMMRFRSHTNAGFDPAAFCIHDGCHRGFRSRTSVIHITALSGVDPTKVVVPTGGFHKVSIPYCGGEGGLTVPSNSRRVLGVDPYGAGVSIPSSHGFRSRRVLGCRSSEAGCRSLRMRGLEQWVSIPDFPSKLTSKLLVRSLVSLLVSY